MHANPPDPSAGPPPHPREAERLATLAGLDILDTPPEQAFDDIAVLAAQICQTPIAAINLIHEGRQWFKARVGSDLGDVPLEAAFCRHTILQDDLMIVRDAAQDDRFKDNPYVTGEPHLRFYAGALLRTGDGLPIGTLCVFDHQPRDLSAPQVEALQRLARQVVSQLELRRILTAREQTEEQFRTVAGSAPVIIWMTDPTGYCTYLNRLWYDFTGQSESEAEGFGWLDATHPDDKAKTGEALQTANAARLPFLIEYRLRRKDGVYRWVIDVSSPRFDENGDFLGYVGSVIDIDERRAAEERLRDSEERLRASEEKLRQITDNLPALVAYVDAEQRYRFNNKAYEAWIGQSPEALYGLHLREAVGEKAYERVKPYIEDALAGKRTGHEWWAPFPGGLRYTKSEYIPDRKEDGSVAGFFVLASDLSEIKRSQTALTESEARLSAVLETVSDGFFALDSEGRFIVFNAAAERFFRRSRIDVLGRYIWDAFPEAKGSEFNRRYVRIVQTGVAETFEVTSSVRPDRIMEMRAAPQPTGGLTVSFSDVTDRKRAEQQVVERSRRLEALAEAVERAPSARTLEDLLKTLGQAARTLSGADGVAMILRQADQCFYAAEDALTPLWQGRSFPMEECVSGWAMLQQETVIIPDVREEARLPRDAYDPTSVRSLVMVPLISEGQANAAIGAYWSEVHAPAPEEIAILEALARTGGTVLARLQAEQALRALNESLEAQVAERTAERDRIWQNSNELMGVFGFDGRRRAINPAWMRVLGYDEETLLNTPFMDVTHPDDRQRLVEAVQSLASGERIVAFEDRLRRADGTYRTISWTGVPGDGVFYAIGRDVTEQRHAEEALRQAQKMEAIGQLTGGVAHDFNNLLTIIRSSTDLLRRPDLPDERRRRYVDAISDTVDRASKLTGQLLAFARRQALKPEVFDIAERIKAVTDMLRTIVGSRVKIVTDIACDSCFVEADVTQFETALVNMAVNARDAMDGEGVLTISVRSRAEMPAIRGYAGGQGNFVAVAITDTGAGIPADRIKHIFEPFFTTKEVGKGTGLGLSQVYGFAKQSGGDVAVESKAGQGATFTLYLPRAVNKPNEEPPGSWVDSLPESGRGHRVLVVEDNTEVGQFSTQVLQDLGYVTVWAANAHRALELLSREPGGFDVVFSDVVMPGMSGVDLGQEIRRLYPNLPVVLTSGYSHVLAEEGLHGFELLHKPYAAQELSRLLRRVMSRRMAPERG